MLAANNWRGVWALCSVLAMALVAASAVANPPTSQSATQPSTALESPTPEMLATVKAGYQALMDESASPEAYREARISASAYAIKQHLGQYDLPPAIAADALLRISEIKTGDLRQDRTVDWCTLTKLVYAEDGRVRAVEDYLAKSTKVDGYAWATLVNLFEQRVDEVLFRALDRVELSESMTGRFCTSLRCTDASKLSPEAKRAFVTKWREVLRKSESAEPSTAKVIEDLIRACLLEGDEATAAVASLRADLAALRTQSAKGTELVDSAESTGARLIVDVWKADLQGDERTGAVLKQFIKDPRLDTPDDEA